MMKKVYKSLKILLLLSCVVLAISCTESGGDDSPSSPSSSIPSENNDVSTRSASTDCGIPVNGNLENPLALRTNTVFSASGISGTLANVRISGDDFTVKLSGVSPKAGQAQAAANKITELSRNGIFYVESLNDCTVIRGGDPVLVGQLITIGGSSISEALLLSGLAEPDINDLCVPGQLLSCYDSLADSVGSSTPTNASDDNSDSGSTSSVSSSGNGFLWKPISEGDGNLVILVPNSKVKIVTVNGERGRSTGASNGRAGTFRFSKPGCSYGSSAKVRGFTSNAVATPLTSDGRTRLTINGCSRFEG